MTAILGFAVAFTRDLIKEKRVAEASLTRVRYWDYHDPHDPQVRTASATRVFSTTVQAIGPTVKEFRVRPLLYILDATIKATSTRIDSPKQPPDFLQSGGQDPDSKPLLIIKNFKNDQKLTWTLEIESNREIPDNALVFQYEGADRLEDGMHLGWESTISITVIASILLAYSALITVACFFLYFRGRRLRI